MLSWDEELWKCSGLKRMKKKKTHIKSLKLKVQKVQTVQLWLSDHTGQSESVRTVMCSVLLVLYSRTLALRWNRWPWSQSADFQQLQATIPNLQTRQRSAVDWSSRSLHLSPADGVFYCWELDWMQSAAKACKKRQQQQCRPAEQPNIEEDNLIWRRRFCVLCGCKHLQAKAENQDFNTSVCFVSDLMCGVKSQHTQRNDRILCKSLYRCCIPRLFSGLDLKETVSTWFCCKITYSDVEKSSEYRKKQLSLSITPGSTSLLAAFLPL